MTDYDGDQAIGNMTLDEVAANDMEMAKDAIKNSKKYAFHTPEKAVRFVGACIGGTLVYLGIPLADKMKPKMLDRIQKQKKIVIEKRDGYQDDDVWRNGLYIYQKDILVAFISTIFKPKKVGFLIAPENQWFVITNAKVS